MRGLRRTPLRALVLGGTCAVMTAVAVSAGLAADAGRSGSSSGLDHAVQRPARADGLEARGGLREAHRRTRRRALRRRGHAREPDHPGRIEVARRCVLRGEPAGAPGAGRAQAAGTGAGSHAEGRSARRQLTLGILGRRVGPFGGARLQHGQDQARGSAELAARPRLAQVEGQGRASPRARPTSSRSSPRSRSSEARQPPWRG